MKKGLLLSILILLTFLSVTAAADVIINDKVFPDANFQQYLKKEIDKNKDGKLSNAEINNTTWIECAEKSIGSLAGIEIFTNLTELDCMGNKLQKLDVSKNSKLQYLGCWDNQLSSLDVSKNTKLISLSCDNNKLTSLTIGAQKNLKILTVRKNPIKSIDISKCPLLCKLIAGKKPEKFRPDSFSGLYGWWEAKDENSWPDKYLFIDPEQKVIVNSSSQTTSVTVSGLKYKLDNAKKTAVFVGAGNKNATSISIPATIKANGKNYKVTEIGTNACKKMKKLAKVTIGKNITKIGKDAFNGCIKLKNIIIKTQKLKAKNIGTNAFKTGCKKSTVKCPKKQLNEYKKILLKKGLTKQTQFTK